MNSSKLPAAVTLAAAMVLIPSTAQAASSVTGPVADRAPGVKIIHEPAAVKDTSRATVKIIHRPQAELSGEQSVKIISKSTVKIISKPTISMLRGQRVKII